MKTKPKTKKVDRRKIVKAIDALDKAAIALKALPKPC